MNKVSIKLLLLIGCCLLLASCRCKQLAASDFQEPVVIHHTDTVWSETVERVRLDTVTVTVEVPAQSAMQTVRDSVSFVETDYAESSAWINPDGSLGHSIRNKEREMSADVIVPTKEINSSRGEKIVEQVPVYINQKVPVEVERELSWWERFRLGAFWWLVGGVAIGGAWIFRKPIVGMIKR